MKSLLELALESEKLFFNDLNNKRGQRESIPIELDYDYEPQVFDYERYTGKIMGQKSVCCFLDIIRGSPGARVIDVCCGSGWVSLLAATRGATVYGYDISDEGIANAKISRERNIERIRSSFGKLDYFHQSVHTIPSLNQENSVDIFIGWSAFHHLADMKSFFDKMKYALSDGGYIISVDDIASEKKNRIITWVFKFILPIKGLPYTLKVQRIWLYVKKMFESETEWHTPMEAFVGKHENAAHEIEGILKSGYKIVWNHRYCAFVHYIVFDIDGPDWFRKFIFDVLWALDCFLIYIKICKGNLRFMVARKYTSQ